MSTCLITGSSGFLGRALVRCLLLRNVHVIAVDLSPDRALLGTPGFTFLPGDLATFEGSAELRPDTVVHLAQSPRYHDFPAGAVDLFQVNVAGAFRTLEFARVSGAARVVMASTGSVYTGAGTGGAPLTEESATGVGEFYAASKLAAEAFARAYAGFFDLSIIRPFALYGPGQRGMLIPSLAARILAGRPVTLEGNEDGMCFTPLYVEDAARILAALLALSPRPGAFEILNLGGAEVVSIRAAAEGLAAGLDREVNIEQVARTPRHLVADSTRIYAAAGIVPEIPFREGIARTAAALRHA